MPPLFNIPKSQLQYTGESVYCSASNLLRRCNREQNPVDRFIYVVAWFISTRRRMTFGVAPYNPILGETHHVSKGNLNVLVEQVSHHPPVTALHATDDKENIEMIWSQQPVPKFYASATPLCNNPRAPSRRSWICHLTIFSTSSLVEFRGNRTTYPGVQIRVQFIPNTNCASDPKVRGSIPTEGKNSTREGGGEDRTSVEAKVNGKGKLKLLNHGETYEMDSANLLYKVFPVPSVDWVGTVNLRCLETCLVAELCFKSSPSFLGLGGNHKVIKGKIFDSSSSKILYELDGQWDRIVKLKDRINGEVRVIYDATKANSWLQSPILKNEEVIIHYMYHMQ
ncbi:hypothetical protein TSUD_375930 [Trifolium subterraneum]|uniref:Oxysterol-binding protein n=1 Tax=Trifolium subterraneum TaxID=3900 RepID=A0A2Z6MP75_TRISU|nr:hypothetical protein TSUD_375930 [Trifolium subterraneum]